MGKRPIAVVIMAAGKGTRMKDPNRAKVMFEILGQPMLHHVLELAYALDAGRVLTIVGYQRETVEQFLRSEHPNAEVCVQADQRGTGHAMMQTTDALKSFAGDVVILSGDVPLLTAESMKDLLDHHWESDAGATILTAEFEDPSGYGRIIRNADGSVQRIVEHKDANEEERNVREINSGIYVIDQKKLADGLGHITPHNVQNEYYLTDIFEYFWKHEWRVSALKALHPDEIRGINTVEQLAEAEAVMKARSVR